MNKSMRIHIISFILISSKLFQTKGFSPYPALGKPQQQVKLPIRSKPKSLRRLTESELTDVVLDARRLFFLWFFGASGGGGIALAAFPKMFARYQKTLSLKGQGPTENGKTIGLSPILGYPEDLSEADVNKVLNNKMTITEMVEKGPKDSFWAERGYLRYEAFQAANTGCNPLAIRVIFDALSVSTDTVEPNVAQALVKEFQGDVAVLKNKLFISKLKGYVAIGFLCFLLGIAAVVSADSFARGWFPDWPGRENFPLGLIDPGLWTIPKYWI